MAKTEVKIRCIAIDDEPLALQQMEGFISKVDYLNLLNTFDNAFDALSYLKANQVDLIFLDVEMDDFTGIQFLEVLDNKPFVILTTAYESYALKGYELDIADYLLKPISYQRFLQSISRVYDKFLKKGLQVTTVVKEPKSENQFMFVKTKYQLQKILFDDILYLEGLSNYLILKLKNEKVYTLMSFKEVGNLLPLDNFIRVHKSFIIALDKIERITKNHAHVGDKNIPIGQTYKLQFFDELRKRNLM